MTELKQMNLPYIHEWLRYHTEQIMDPSLRDIVKQSWYEATSIGLNGMDQPRLLYLNEKQLGPIQERSSSLTKIVAKKIKKLQKELNEKMDLSFFLVNEQGILLKHFKEHTQDPYYPDFLDTGLLMGFPFLSHTAVSLSLKTKKLTYLIGAEHFYSKLHPYTSIAMPIFHPINRECIGSIAIFTSAEQPISLLRAVMCSMAMAIEESISIEYSHANIFKIHEEITNLMDHFLLIVGSDGRIVDCNKAIQALLPEAHIIGAMAKDFFEKNFSHHYREGAMHKALFYKEETSNREIWTSIKGKRYCFLVDTKIVHDPFDSQFFWVIDIFKDITQKKEMDLTLIQREKMVSLGTLAAGLAHEIRNPLTTAKGFIQLLSEGSPHQEQFLLIQNELNRITQLVNQFVLLSKPDSPQLKNLSVRCLLDEFVHFIKPEALLKGIEVITDLADQDIKIRADKNQLTQVFINLSQNAFNAMQNGGVLRISYHRSEDDYVEIRFIDNGAGIRHEHLAKILDPFFTTREEGTGLGLPICYQIIEAHQGEFKVTSECNVGTTVLIRLPQQNHL